MRTAVITVIATIAIVLLIGCAGYKGEQTSNTSPNIILYNSPSDSAVVAAAPIMYWFGPDKDGECYTYQYIDIVKSRVSVDDYYSYYNFPNDIPDMIVRTDGDTINWVFTNENSDTIFFSLEEGEDTTEHLFCVKSLDNDSASSETKCVVVYRINTPPDSCYIETEQFTDDQYDTVWCLYNTTYSWNGIDLSWRGHDPDNSIILEYYWQVEDIHTGAVVRTSLADDSVQVAMYAGRDTTDGWVRMTTTKLVDIPTGDYRMVLKIRDDAFYTGVADTIYFTAVKPIFDPSDPEIFSRLVNGTFPHSLLFLDETTDGPVSSLPSESVVDAFYEQLLDNLVSMGTITGYRVMEAPGWAMTRHELADYSLLYILDIDKGFAAFKLSEESIKGLKDYIAVGGRVLMEGRYSFYNSSPEPSLQPYQDSSLAYNYFGVAAEGSYTGMGQSYLIGAIPVINGYPTLTLNTENLSLGQSGDITGIFSEEYIGARSLGYAGLPASEIIYRFNCGDFDTTDSNYDTKHIYQNKPIAIRYKTSSFRAAYIGLPLIYMKNDEGQVNDAVALTLDFLKTQFPEDTTTSSGL